ncbi:hypothetical protein [Kribbella sp. NPDC051770]|uniref:hypothetical protein n=1 Tax=Kribbella sp. NPDC051770 TaxID=3155413 RepID=UPI0034480808
MKKLLLGLIGALVLIGGGLTYVVSARGSGPSVDARPVTHGAITLQPGQLLFRNTAAGPSYGKLAQDGATRTIADLHCDRIAVAHGTGICLRSKPGSLPPLSEVLVLGPDLAVRHKQTLPGTPSRARVSPDGKLVNWTLFVTGDSYAATGFSTRSGLYEVETGRLVKSIEELPVFVNGRRYFAHDSNYWGITFAADGSRFYATLGSKGKTYLIEADYRTYRGTAILENAECPSLSPDGRRVAFKQKNPDGTWRIAVLDLTTRRVSYPPESRHLDDQVLWKDSTTLLYTLQRPDKGTDIWSTPIGTGTPTLVVPDAASPAIT